MIDFTYTNRIGDAPIEVQFTDTSVGTYTYRKWLFGDGNSDDSNNVSVSHIYKNPGVYSVTLITGNATEQEQLVKEDIVFVNENIEDTQLVIAESTDRTGLYWKMYIDLDGKLVFETPNKKKITKDKIVLVNRWMFIEYHVQEDKFYIGTYANGRLHKQHIDIDQSIPLVPGSNGSLKIASNSSYIIDDLKVWSEDRDLYDYFSSLRGRAGYLDPVL